MEQTVTCCLNALFHPSPSLRLWTLHTTAENIEPFPERRSNNEDVSLRYLVAFQVIRCACVSVEYQSLCRTVCAHKHTVHYVHAQTHLEKQRDCSRTQTLTLYLFIQALQTVREKQISLYCRVNRAEGQTLSLHLSLIWL